jgi:glycosyltransferase involved in cell wall biosynthesis
MLGFRENPYSYMRYSDALILSSHAEGFGNVLIEAMATGTNVIATNCPHGPDEITEDGRYGRLVPMRNVEAMAQAMQHSIEAPLLEEAAVKARAKDFSVQKIGEEYLNFFKSH